MKELDLRRLSHNIATTFGRQVLTAILNLLVVVLIARVYGPEGNGAFVLALLLPTMLASFLNLGVAPANVYFLGSNQVTVRNLPSANARIFFGWVPLVCSGACLLLWNASGIFPGIPPLILWFALDFPN